MSTFWDGAKFPCPFYGEYFIHCQYSTCAEALLNSPGINAQFQRNACSISPVWLRNSSGICTLRGVKPCLAGVICATGVHLAIQLLTGSAEVRFDCVTALLMAGLAIGAAAYQRIRKKQLSPILLIVAAAALRSLIY